MNVAKFEKVSFEQFASDYMNTFKSGSSFLIDKIYENIKLPERSTKLSAGHDFRSTISTVIKPGCTVKIPTGIKCKMKDDYVLMLYVRSSIGFKHDTVLSNGTGIVDADYINADNEGHIFVKLINHGDKPIAIKEGDKICQGVFVKYGIADENEVTTERMGGFGSTGE